MLGSYWLFGLLAGVMALHALVMYRAYRLHGESRPSSSDTARVDPEEGVVECPACRTTNESGYRYCRSCVTELPSAMAFERDGDSPLGRVMR